MASKISEEQAAKNVEVIGKLVAAQREPRRACLEVMLDKLDEFFTAPASAREDYHGCYPGGLADHSLRVAKNLKTLATALAPGRYPADQLVFVGLFHDFGKVGDVGTPLYIPNPSDWHRGKGMLYESNKALPYMPVCDRTMYLLQKFGVTLEAEEYIALRISDGPLEKCNEKYGMKEPDLAILLHMADRWACSQEKQP